MSVRVRYAPSPTGYVHIGGARTALFNWLFARKHRGQFILRIEDTDAERTIHDSAQQIIEQLRWLGLDWDEGPDVGGGCAPYYQSQRRSLYEAEACRLVREGQAYFCYCTPEELDRQRAEAREQGRVPKYPGTCRHQPPAGHTGSGAVGRAIRLRAPETGITEVNDHIHGSIEFDNSLMGDLVILKSDGYPTYNFACVVDDIAMDVSHVIRADEHVSNTPKQIWIYKALGHPLPVFAHVPMVLAPDRSKLSKRHGATSVGEFQELGYVPEAIVNYLAFLGWSPQGEAEAMPIAEMVEQFSLDAVSPTASIYDVGKLTWMNGHYLRTLDVHRALGYAIPFLARAGLVRPPLAEPDYRWLLSLWETIRDRVKTLGELPAAVEYFFQDVTVYDQAGAGKHFSGPAVAPLLMAAASTLAQLPTFDLESIEAACRELISRSGIASGALIHPVRLALTGRTTGPGLFHIIWLLGQERTVQRLEAAACHIESGTRR
ncbi:MAG TPA: glutamate--tRNA ligase [Clostridiales bacterium UBA8153]|nr:glutamate--tRNA ligase [Clostridiales bacterium UBA8153]